MAGIMVHRRYDDEFAVLVRGNLIHIDQPIEAGGGDAGPTPTELFVASPAACAAFLSTDGRKALIAAAQPLHGAQLDHADARDPHRRRPGRARGMTWDRTFRPAGKEEE